MHAKKEGGGGQCGESIRGAVWPSLSAQRPESEPQAGGHNECLFSSTEEKAGWVGDRDILLDLSQASPSPAKASEQSRLQIRRVAFEVPREEGTLWGLPEELERGPRLLLFPGVLCISNKENAKQSYKTCGIYILNVYIE